MRLPFALLFVLLGAGLAPASTLRPSMIIYGVIRDSYGIRLGPDAAFVSAFLGATEVARTPTRVLPNGANYRLEVNVSDPLTVATNEVAPGATLTLRVKMGAVLQPTIGTNTFLARGDGSVVNLNLVLGVDSDGDGLPDDWERMVIANSGGMATSLSQVGPGRDLDGDGMSDDKEFWYGSFAFLPGDELRMSLLARHPNGRLSFALATVNGGIYAVEAAPSLDSPSWLPCPVSLTETGALSSAGFTGDGSQVRVFFVPVSPTYFYRLRYR